MAKLFDVPKNGTLTECLPMFADVPTVASRASKFIDNRALISFRGFIFA